MSTSPTRRIARLNDPMARVLLADEPELIARAARIFAGGYRRPRHLREAIWRHRPSGDSSAVAAALIERLRHDAARVAAGAAPARPRLRVARLGALLAELRALDARAPKRAEALLHAYREAEPTPRRARRSARAPARSSGRGESDWGTH